MTLRTFCLAACVVLTAATAQAQSTGDAELRAQQAALFDQMFKDPENLELMFEYALISVELRDFEAAISTLDRILIFNPDLPRARLELGAAYYRIGSYQFAREYIEQAREHPNATEDVQARADEFLSAIDQRTRKNYITGVFQAGLIGSTNANKGPSSRDILFLGLDARLVGSGVTSQADVGAFANLQLTHVYDLGGADAEEWRTNAVAYSQRFLDTTDGAADVFVLRSGPSLALDDDRYGLRARPFIELDHVRSSEDALYSTLGAGLEVSNTLTRNVTLNADLRAGWRDFHDGGDLDGVNLRGAAGVNYFQSDATAFGGRVLFEYEGSDDRSERAYEVGLEGTIIHRYDSGFDFADRNWQVETGARASVRFFDQPGFADPGTTRRDVDLRLGVANLAYIDQGVSVLTKAEYFVRESNIKNFDLDSLTLVIGLQYNF